MDKKVKKFIAEVEKLAKKLRINPAEYSFRDREGVTVIDLQFVSINESQKED